MREKDGQEGDEMVASPPLFCELLELNDEATVWNEKARWIKYEVSSWDSWDSRQSQHRVVWKRRKPWTLVFPSICFSSD